MGGPDSSPVQPQTLAQPAANGDGQTEGAKPE